MKQFLINKIRKMSIRYGFYTHLVKIKEFLGELKQKYYKADKELSALGASGSYLLIDSKVLNEEPTWKTLSVQSGARVVIKAQVDYCQEETKKRKAILLAKCFDNNGKELGIKLGHLSYSSKLEAHFRYLAPTGGEKKVIHEFKVPPLVSSIEIGLARFNAKVDEEVVISGFEALIKAEELPDLFLPPSKEAAEISILGWPEYPENGRPYVIGVMDEFTTSCFERELNLIQPRPDNWYALAEKYSPTMFFIESAWKGNNGSWQYRVGEYLNKPGQEVAYITQYARKKGIPSVFWNKEDPVHHQKFMCSAKLVDYIFTTDANMCDSYRKNTGNNNVFALPFAAQPALHKPSPLAGRLPRSCFAGSWYGNRHAERGQAMRWLLQAANRHGLDIYDRNYGTGIFTFPDEYQAGIKGSLPYKELCAEYSRYRVFLNVNSVTKSPTMFSRRVFELLACGTPVVSTYARGIEELLGLDAVWMVRSEQEAEEAIRTLLTDDNEWRRRSLAGIREVFSHHTYAHRMNEVFEKIGLEERIPTEPGILLVAQAGNEAELYELMRVADRLTYRNFKLIIETPDVSPVGIPQAVDIVKQGYIISQSLDVRAKEVSAIGWLSPNVKYGAEYLRDLVNAMVYQPEASGWAKALKNDAFAFNEPSVLEGALWKSSVFLEKWRRATLGQLIQQDDLFCIDSAELSVSTSRVHTVGA